MSSNYSKRTTPELLKLLETFTGATEGTIKHAAEILHELHKRGETHPAMKEGVLRWFAVIADGKLTPKAAMTFAGVGAIIRKLLLVHPAKQDSLAMGEKIVIAVHNADGTISPADRTILQLTTRQLDQAFGDKGLRDFTAQKRILAARGPDKRRSAVAISIRADISTGELICGQMRFKPSQLSTALKELGFQIVRTQKRAA